MQGHIGNANLESFTHEKISFTARPEFGSLSGHTMIIFKALYGLHLSGLCFHEKLVDTLRAMDFSQSYADPDVWMHAPTTSEPLVPYDYVVVYIDNLFATTNDPQQFFDALQNPPWNYKLKETCEPHYHLGANFSCDTDGILYMGTQTYPKRLLANYENLFGDLPYPIFSPLPENDCPKLDYAPLCGLDGVAKFQSLQWMISLCTLIKPNPSCLSLTSIIAHALGTWTE